MHRSGQMAADAIHTALGAGDTSGARLGAWGPGFNAGVDRMRRLVCEYYAGFSFGAFVLRYPELKGKITDVLIGDVFSGGDGQTLGKEWAINPRKLGQRCAKMGNAGDALDAAFGGAEGPEKGFRWRGVRDAFRTLVVTPPADVRAVLERIRGLKRAA